MIQQKDGNIFQNHYYKKFYFQIRKKMKIIIFQNLKLPTVVHQKNGWMIYQINID
jgi:hypothetical protein